GAGGDLVRVVGHGRPRAGPGGREVPAVAEAEAVAVGRAATAGEALPAGGRVPRVAPRAQGGEAVLLLGADVVVVQLLEAVDRVEKHQAAVAAAVAGPAAHPVGQAHQRLD